MLRIRMLRVRLYPGYSYRRIPLGAGACARGEGEALVMHVKSTRRGTRREGEAHREEHMECT